jgi:hypothetical protein
MDPMSNTPDAHRLRIKSLLSYEGYEEYYNVYKKWAEEQKVPLEKKMSREEFESRLSQADTTTRQQIAIEARRLGLTVPPNYAPQQVNIKPRRDQYQALSQGTKLGKPVTCPHCQEQMPLISGHTRLEPNRPGLCVSCGGLTLTQADNTLVKLTPDKLAEMEFRGLITAEDHNILTLVSQRVKADKARGVITNIPALMAELRNLRN